MFAIFVSLSPIYFQSSACVFAQSAFHVKRVTEHDRVLQNGGIIIIIISMQQLYHLL